MKIDLSKNEQWTSGDKVEKITQSQSTVSGILAAINISIIVLIAQNTLSGLKGTLQTVTLGLLIVSFFGHIAVGIINSMIFESNDDNDKTFIFSLSACLIYLSIIISFEAFLPLSRMFNIELNILIHSLIICGIVRGFMGVTIPLIKGLKNSYFNIILSFILAVLIAFIIQNTFCINVFAENNPLFLNWLFTIYIATVVLLFIFVCITILFLELSDNFKMHFANFTAGLICALLSLIEISLLIN